MPNKKLPSDELKCVQQALLAMGQVCGAYDVYSRLRDMVREGTTDGKPCVDPEPPIPDGWRLAVAGDEGRQDHRYWDRSAMRWLSASGVMERDDSGYIVPVDHVPTDEDAQNRPEVMVRDAASCRWVKAKLYGVVPETSYPFLVCEWPVSGRYKFCRFPYPGE